MWQLSNYRLHDLKITLLEVTFNSTVSWLYDVDPIWRAAIMAIAFASPILHKSIIALG
jgi:hypothetical protein